MGRDSSGEWIRLINTGKAAINTEGWTLSDKSGKTFYFSNLLTTQRSILPGEELTLKYSQTKIILNNSGDTLYLYNKAKKLIDEFTYTGQINNDEIVFTPRFIKTAETHTAIATESIKNLSTNQAKLVNGQLNTSPLFISIILAVLSGVFGGIIAREIRDKND